MNPTHLTRAILALVALLVLTRLPALVHPKAIDDEQVYAVVAHAMLDGGRPYVDAVERKPPLLFYLYAGVLQVVGRSNWPGLHLVAVLWTLATMASLGLLAGRLWGRPAGLAAALLYGLFLGWGDYRNLALNGELLMNLPVAGAVTIALWPTASRIRPELLLAGALVAVAFLLKQPSGITALPLGVYLLLPAYRRERGLTAGHSLLHGAWLTLGFAGAMAAAGAWLRHAGILEPAVYWTFLSNQSAAFGPLTLVFWDRAASNGGLFLLCTAPLLLAAFLSLREGRGPAGWWRDRQAERTGLLLLLAASFVGVGFNGQFLYHYFLQVIPFLALLAAPLVGQRLWGPAPALAWRIGLATAAAVFLVVHTIGISRQRSTGASAQYVRTHSAPADRLFVWGQGTRQTGLYLDADRRPASRYIASFPLTGHIFGSPVSWNPDYDTSDRIAPGAWDTLAAEFSRHPPRYIIDTDAVRARPVYRIDRYPFLRDYLAREYRQVAVTPDGVVYQRVAGH